MSTSSSQAKPTKSRTKEGDQSHKVCNGEHYHAARDVLATPGARTSSSKKSRNVSGSSTMADSSGYALRATVIKQGGKKTSSKNENDNESAYESKTTSISKKLVSETTSNSKRAKPSDQSSDLAAAVSAWKTSSSTFTSISSKNNDTMTATSITTSPARTSTNKKKRTTATTTTRLLSHRSALLAKVHSAQNSATRHYSVTLPSSVKASNVLHIRLPLPFGDRIVIVTCPSNMPSAKYNKRRSLIVVVSPQMEVHLASLMGDEIIKEADNVTVSEVKCDDGIDCQFEWRDLESVSSNEQQRHPITRISGGEEKKDEERKDEFGVDSDTTSSSVIVLPSNEKPASGIDYVAGASRPTPNKKSSTSSNTSNDMKSTPTPPTISTYIDMAHFALANLKERNGSSIPALSKYIISAFSEKLDGKKNVKNHLTNALKTGVKSGRFVRLRNSFKLDSEWVKKEKAKKIALKKSQLEKKKLSEAAAKESKEAKEKSDQQQLAKKSNEENEELKKKRELEERVKVEEAEEARMENFRQERAHKRKFPMDDLQLIMEDKELMMELCVSPRPVLPLAFHPLQCPVVEDVMHIYNVLFGDVGYFCMDNREVKFSLKQLGNAFMEVERGNTKRAKCLPPLLLHLLTTLLRKLLTIKDDTSNNIYASPSDTNNNNREVDGPADNIIAQRKTDIESLSDALTPSSCGEIVRLYMELMDRLSIERYPTGYLQEEDEEVTTVGGHDTDTTRDPFFFGYLGPPSGTLHSVVKKLAYCDIWCLDVGDISCLFKTLCDDILSRKSYVATTISERGESLNDLLKAKKNAETQFRKAKMAFEGPKTNRKKWTKRNDANQDENVGRVEESLTEKPLHVPTISVDEFESTKSAMEKANSAYSKGLRKYASRTQPLGYDRDHNAVYLFSSDPTMIFVEMRCTSSTSLPTAERQASSWHVIETKSIYDSYVSSLDQRGIRENELNECLQSEGARKNLYDDVKELNDTKQAHKRIQELDLRLEHARLAVQVEDDSGRRSGRLASIAQMELAKIESEMKTALALIGAKTRLPHTPCYRSLTGLEILCDYDIARMKDYLKEMPSIKVTFRSRTIPKHVAGLRGSKHTATPLWKVGGVIDVLTSEIFELDSWILSVTTPRGKSCSPQQDWQVKVREALTEWKQITSHCVGPLEKEENSDLNDTVSLSKSSGNDPTPSKRNSKCLSISIREMESLQSAVSGILDPLKGQLLELEETMRSISGLEHTSKIDELASSYESESEENNDEDNTRQAWKTHVEKLNRVDNKKHMRVRLIIIDAITAAREAGLNKVVGELRGALKQIRQFSSGAAKMAALEVLRRHGGCSVSDREQVEELDMDDDATADAISISEGEGSQNDSLLSEDASALGACIDGSDDAVRDDWVEAVKSCKTIARFAALMQTFVQKAMEVLGKLEEGHDSLWNALAIWQKQQKEESLEISEKRISRDGVSKKSQQRLKKKAEGIADADTFLWINCSRTFEIVLAKVPGRPWWPACICHPHDQKVVRALASINCVLLCYVGREELHVIKEKETKKYASDAENKSDLSEYDSDIIAKYRNSLALSRRIYRAKEVGMPHRED